MRAVIFDLDGVLVRTDQAHDKAWRALAGRLGIPFDGRAAARLRGVSRMEALDIVLEGCGRSFKEVQRWTEMSPAEKRQVWRRITLQGDAWRFNRYAERAGAPAAAPDAEPATPGEPR